MGLEQHGIRIVIDCGRKLLRIVLMPAMLLSANWLYSAEQPVADQLRAFGTRGGLIVHLAATDKHTVYSLNAANGRIRWQYTAGARIDSPPAIYKNRVIFGGSDGWVYCLRTSDGLPAWRFRAAQDECRIMAFDQLESPWPVSGSVLILQDKVYFAAGRSSFLAGVPDTPGGENFYPALEGAAVLWAVSAEDGKTMTELTLLTLPRLLTAWLRQPASSSSVPRTVRWFPWVTSNIYRQNVRIS